MELPSADPEEGALMISDVPYLCSPCCCAALPQCNPERAVKVYQTGPRPVPTVAPPRNFLAVNTGSHDRGHDRQGQKSLPGLSRPSGSKTCLMPCCSSIPT